MAFPSIFSVFSNFLRLTHAKNQQGSNSSASNDILFNKSFLEKMSDLQRRFDSETE